MQPYEFLNEWRSSLLNFGLGPKELIAIAVVLTFSCLLATREVLSWFLKVDTLKKEVRSLRAEIEALRMDLQNSNSFSEPKEKAQEPATATVSEPFYKKNRAFRIFH